MGDHVVNSFVGARSYEETDKEIFFGREEEIAELFQLIGINLFTLLYGRSGLGKTSLIKAGIFPKLRKANFFPIYIKPDYTDDATNYVKQIETLLEEAVKQPRLDDEYSIDKLNSGETLWEYFHRAPIRNSKTKKELVPVLVFDQFEEIFTLGTKDKSSELRQNINDLIHFLSDLIENSPPENIADEKRLQLQYLYDNKRFPLKILFSFREEYLSNFYSLSNIIPSIAYSNLQYRLCPLTYFKGFSIITKASKGYFEDDAIPETLRVISEADTLEEAKGRDIDSFLLSIFCESQIRELGPGKKVSQSQVQKIDIQRLVNSIYQTAVLELDLNSDEKKLLEDTLISPDGYRLPVYLSVVLKNSKIREEKINQLLSRKILKRYFVDGRHCIEIIHDKYAAAVKQERDFRVKAQEEQSRLLKDQEELERQRLQHKIEAQKHQARKLEDERNIAEQRTRMRNRFLISIVSLGIALIVLFYIFYTSSIDVIINFSSAQSKALDNVQQARGSYTSFLAADSFNNYIRTNFINKSWFLYSPKLKKLQTSLDDLTIAHFNKRPFFRILDSEIPSGEKYYPKMAGTAHVVRQDSLLVIDFVDLKMQSIHLTVPSKTIAPSNVVISRPNGSPGRQSFGIGPGGGVKHISTERYTLLLKDSSLHLFTNRDRRIIASWEVKFSELLFQDQPFVISSNDRYVVGRYLLPQKDNDKPLQEYVIIPIKDSTDNRIFLQLPENETLLNICDETDATSVAYMKSEKPAPGWHHMLSKVVELKAKKFVRAKWVDEPPIATTMVSLNYSPRGNAVTRDPKVFMTSASGQHIFFKDNPNDEWTIFDLHNPHVDLSHKMDGSISGPLELLLLNRDSIVLTDSFNLACVRDQRCKTNPKLQLPMTSELKSFTVPGMSLRNILPTNQKGWLTVNVLVNTVYPYVGLFRLADYSVFLFPNSTQSPIYIQNNKSGNSRAIFLGQSEYVDFLEKTPVTHWFFEKNDSTANIDDVNEWRKRNYLPKYDRSLKNE